MSSQALDHEVTVDLRNTEARLLWREIEKLKPEQSGRNAAGRPTVPALGVLYLMLRDVAEQLEEKLPEPDDD